MKDQRYLYVLGVPLNVENYRRALHIVIADATERGQKKKHQHDEMEEEEDEEDKVNDLTQSAADLQVSQSVNYVKHLAIAGVDQDMILAALDSLVATAAAVKHKSLDEYQHLRAQALRFKNELSVSQLVLEVMADKLYSKIGKAVSKSMQDYQKEPCAFGLLIFTVVEIWRQFQFQFIDVALAWWQDPIQWRSNFFG